MIWLVNLKTFFSHHKLYVQDHQFTKDVSNEFNWKTELRVQISLETINGNKEPILIETKVTSKAGFNQIWHMEVHYLLKAIKVFWNQVKTVKEGERRASSKILDEMNVLISDASYSINVTTIPKKKFPVKNFFRLSSLLFRKL